MNKIIVELKEETTTMEVVSMLDEIKAEYGLMIECPYLEVE